jgi:hypothetical protein
MRICLVVLSGITLVAGAAVASDDDDVLMKDLPANVRATVEKEAKGAVVEDIERKTRNGKTYYEIELERDNQEWELRIDDTGKVIDRKLDT